MVASGLVDAMPVRAVQGRHDCPACRGLDEVTDVGVGEVIAWRALHGPVLPLECDIAGHDVVEVPFGVEAVVPFGDRGLAASAFDPVAANVHRLDEGQGSHCGQGTGRAIRGRESPSWPRTLACMSIHSVMMSGA